MASETCATVFRDAIRERDRRCVVTGRRAIYAEFGVWRTFQAAHIFPLAYEGYWTANNYGCWITIQPETYQLSPERLVARQFHTRT